MAKSSRNTKDKENYNITLSQGREAFVGSLFLCESALHATKPPKPAAMIVKVG